MTHVGGIDVIGLWKVTYKQQKKIVLFPLANVHFFLINIIFAVANTYNNVPSFLRDASNLQQLGKPLCQSVISISNWCDSSTGALQHLEKPNRCLWFCIKLAFFWIPVTKSLLFRCMVVFAQCVFPVQERGVHEEIWGRLGSALRQLVRVALLHVKRRTNLHIWVFELYKSLLMINK